eukprot:3931929-Rhodomonas_salina.2
MPRRPARPVVWRYSIALRYTASPTSTLVLHGVLMPKASEPVAKITARRLSLARCSVACRHFLFNLPTPSVSVTVT